MSKLIPTNSLSSHKCHFIRNYFFQTKLLHAYVQCVFIVKATYQTAQSKTVVGLDRPMKAPSMHIQKALLGENCLSSNSCHLVRNYYFQIKLLHAYVQYVYIVVAKHQIAPSIAVAGVDRPMKALSMHIQKPYK